MIIESANVFTDSIHRAARSACHDSRICYPSPPTPPVAPSKSAFACLESLWDPKLVTHTHTDMYKNTNPHTHTHTHSEHSSALPRAEYEQDCELWVRAPLSQRGILHLACLVADSSLHVHSDHDLAFHVDALAHRMDFSDLSDEAILATRRNVRMLAISRTVGVDMLIDGGVTHATLCESDGQRDACAWLRRDGGTGTWMARIFPGDSLTAPRGTAQMLAFTHNSTTSSSSFRDLIAACRRSGIPLPPHPSREGLLSHIRTYISLDP